MGWADVATKRDLDHLRVLTRADIDQLGAELRGEMGLFSERMFDRMTAQTRTLVFSVMGSALSVAALTMTAVRIG